MIANTFIKRPVTAIVISIVLIISGTICIFNLAVDQYPNISPPSVSITGQYTGADAQTVEQTGEYFVFIARDSAAHLMAMQVKVEEGKTIGSNVIITKGLKEGDRIVVDGVQALHDGSAITTANKRGPAAAGGRGK